MNMIDAMNLITINERFAGMSSENIRQWGQYNGFGSSFAPAKMSDVAGVEAFGANTSFLNAVNEVTELVQANVDVMEAATTMLNELAMATRSDFMSYLEMDDMLITD
jgi:hypothetical protein